MDGWEDLDHCSSCGKPLGEPEGSPVEAANGPARGADAGAREKPGRNGQSAERPRPA
jgi:hypothetical protein